MLRPDLPDHVSRHCPFAEARSQIHGGGCKVADRKRIALVNALAGHIPGHDETVTQGLQGVRLKDDGEIRSRAAETVRQKVGAGKAVDEIRVDPGKY